MNISHWWDEDLDVFLIAPDGRRVELFTDVGGSGAGFRDTVLDDEAWLSITEGAAPFTGSFRPEGSLSDFVGKDIFGTWVLEVIDDDSQLSGTLDAWSLLVDLADIVYYAECAADEDFTDILADSGWIVDYTHTFPDLSPCKPYWYRVKARPLETWFQTAQPDFEADVLTDTQVTDAGDVVLAGGSGLGHAVHVIEDPSYELGQGWTKYATSDCIKPWRYNDWVTHGSGCFEIWFRSSCSSEHSSGDYGSFGQMVDWTTVDSLAFDYHTKYTGEVQAQVFIGGMKVWSIPPSTAGNSKGRAEVDVSHIKGVQTIELSGQCVTSGDFFAAVQYDNLRTYGPGTRKESGSIVSVPIDLNPEDTWDVVLFNSTVLNDTTVTVDVLPETGATAIPGYANVLSGTILSDVKERTIRLRANLSTNDPTVTPILHDWSVSYTGASCESDWSDTVKCGPLSEALDSTLVFKTGDPSSWFCQTSTFYYDGEAIRSGDISNNQTSWIETTVTGPGTVSFYWKVSSEHNYDFLEFHIDDTAQDQISGSRNWHQMTYQIPAESHVLRWLYRKDHSATSGSDCGWIDKVLWTPDL